MSNRKSMNHYKQIVLNFNDLNETNNKRSLFFLFMMAKRSKIITRISDFWKLTLFYSRRLQLTEIV